VTLCLKYDLGNAAVNGQLLTLYTTLGSLFHAQGKKTETILTKTKVALQSPLRRLILKWHMLHATGQCVVSNSCDSFFKCKEAKQTTVQLPRPSPSLV